MSSVHSVTRTVSITEAKRQLSRLVQAAANGEPVIITRNGKPVVKVVAVGVSESGLMCRIGFLDGKILVPEDFDRMGFAEIERQFQGGE